MRSERFDEVERAFLLARELPPELRDDVLDRQGLDREVRALVEKLLAYDGSPDDPFVTPALGRGFTVPPPERLAGQGPGERWIGEYRLLEVLAVGGMGVVYRAEQASPRRDVALKLLRSADPTREAFARFQAEAQILGRLQHPSIAQIFEAGCAATGSGERPFLAMELVRGPTLDAYVRARRADVRERVELLVQVCDAVHHAHERGVLHCDLKPGNVLVAPGGLPKVIDFGVGRLLDQGSRACSHAGTVAFLSPEQLPGSTREPDARSDVYALGLCLHHLLASPSPSSSPHPALQADRLAPLDLPRTPEDPHGDLDAVVRRATQPDPGRRHPTARALAEDLRAFLDLRPVPSRAGGSLYRLRKAFRRHRREALVAATGGLALLAAFATGWRSRELLQAARTHAADLVRSRDVAAGRAARVQSYLVSLLSAAGPLDLGREASLGALIERVASEVDTAFAEDPEVEVAIRTVLSQLHRLDGDLEAAQREIVRAHERALAALGEDDPATLETLHLLGCAAYERGDLVEAERAFRRLLELSERAPAGGHDPAHALGPLAETLQSMGRFEEAQAAWQALLLRPPEDPGDPLRLLAQAQLGALGGSHDPAEVDRLLSDALDGAKRLFGPRHPQTIRAANLRAAHRFTSGLDVPGARRELERLAVEAAESLGPDHPETLACRHNLACAIDRDGDPRRAAEVARDVLERRRARLGDEHPETLRTWNNLAHFELEAGNLLRARELLEELVRVAERALPPGHLGRGVFLGNLGEAQRKTGSLAAAEASLTRALGELAHLDEDGPGSISPQLSCMYLGVCSQMGLLCVQEGEPRRALPYLRKTYEGHRRTHGPLHPHTEAAGRNLAEALATVGRSRESEELFHELVETRRAAGAEADVPLLGNLARRLAGWGRGDEILPLCLSLVDDEVAAGMLAADVGCELSGVDDARAEELLLHGLEVCEERLGPRAPRVLGWKHALAVALTGQGRFEDAEFLWAEVTSARAEVLGTDHPDTLESLDGHGACLLAAHRPAEALDVLTELERRCATVPVERVAADLPRYHGRRGQALLALRRYDEARAELEEGARLLFARAGPDARAPFLEPLRTVYRLQGLDPGTTLAALAPPEAR